MEKNNTSSQAHKLTSSQAHKLTSSQAHKHDVYSWTYIINGYGSAYKRTYRHLAKSNSYLTTLGIFAKASDWLNPPIAPPSENWQRESNKFNSKMKKTYDRGKTQCIPAFTKCVPS